MSTTDTSVDDASAGGSNKGGSNASDPTADKVAGMKSPTEQSSPAPAKSEPSGVMRVLGAFTSQKLAVVLLVVLGLLTWLGTLAQIEGGLWATQREYFESWGLIAELPLSFWGNEFPSIENQWVIKIPLPGAYPVMILLFLNILIGGMMRFKRRARNVGVLITHIGIALLLVAGFVKLEYSYSGALALFESPENGVGVTTRAYESSRFVSFHDYELALLTDKGDTIEERIVPEYDLARARYEMVTLQADALPFSVQVHHFLDNCRPMPKGPMSRSTTPVIASDDGSPAVYLQPLKVDPERSNNSAGAYVRVMVDGEKHAEGIVYGLEMLPRERRRFPFTFEVEGQRYGLDLRKVIYDLPFALRLERFVKRDHPGTMTPADYRSFVKVLGDGPERDVQIYMNTPLRKDDFVVYQTSWGPQINGRPAGGPPWYSVFEVSKNPSDQWPMYACFVIAIGLLIHMLMKLIRFLQSSSRTTLTA